MIGFFKCSLVDDVVVLLSSVDSQICVVDHKLVDVHNEIIQHDDLIIIQLVVLR